jgi:hypothetical protein
MHKVFKYPLEIEDEQLIMLPQDAEPLRIMVQNNIPCLWVRLQTTGDCPTVAWTIITRGTGHPAPSEQEATYIDSYMLSGGQLVFHVFVK